MEYLLGLLKEILSTYLEIAPYLLLGLSFAGLLHVIFNRDFILNHLGQNNFWSVLKASVLGVPLPLCSCGVIPTALYLRKQKASQGATLSFLISTPQTGVDSIIATYGMMGPVFAVFRPVFAFVMGIAGGLITNFFDKEKINIKKIKEEGFSCVTCDSDAPHQHSILEKLNSGVKYAFVEFLDDISLQLIFGIILAGIISFIIPDNFFQQYGGDGLLGMLFMMAFAIPLYVCATASIPIAVSLMLKGLSPGAALVFLIAGPATNIATITLIGRALGRKMVIIYLSVIAVFALIGGYLLNFVYSLLGEDTISQVMQHHSSKSLIIQILIIIFSLMLLASIYRKFSGKFGHAHHHNHDHEMEIKMSSNIKKFSIEGMTCNHCVKHVQDSILEVNGVEKAEVILNDKSALIEGEYSEDEIIEAVKKAGYRASI
ncbi:SO_0444 family Cu/Zn efflux transporter [Candidatus Cloacimonadota bacterium]